MGVSYGDGHVIQRWACLTVMGVPVGLFTIWSRMKLLYPDTIAGGCKGRNRWRVEGRKGGREGRERGRERREGEEGGRGRREGKKGGGMEETERGRGGKHSFIPVQTGTEFGNPILGLLPQLACVTV